MLIAATTATALRSTCRKVAIIGPANKKPASYASRLCASRATALSPEDREKAIVKLQSSGQFSWKEVCQVALAPWNDKISSFHFLFLKLRGSLFYR
jgi:hypothetical protein